MGGARYGAEHVIRKLNIPTLFTVLCLRDTRKIRQTKNSASDTTANGGLEQPVTNWAKQQGSHTGKTARPRILPEKGIPGCWGRAGS